MCGGRIEEVPQIEVNRYLVHESVCVRFDVSVCGLNEVLIGFQALT